jgi:hypothetical protein
MEGIPETRTVTVLFPTGDRIPYEMTNDAAVSDLVHRIRDDPNAKKPANRNIVIIYQGRILQSTDILSSIETTEEFTVHAFFRTAHADAQSDPSADLRGFDRLSRMNYTPEQILEIRQNFHLLHHSMDDTLDVQLDAEEEWLPAIFNHENPLQDLQLPAPAGPPHPAVNPIANNNEDDAAHPQDDGMLMDFPWLKFVFGAIIGSFLGATALVFLLVAQDVPFTFGLLGGICGHYVWKWFFSG